MGDVVARVEVRRDAVRQEGQVGDLGGERVGIADRHGHLGLLALSGRVHLEDHLVVAIGQDAAFVGPRSTHGSVELEHVITGGRPRRVSVDDPLGAARRQDAAGDRRRRVQVVVDIDPIALVAQLG